MKKFYFILILLLSVNFLKAQDLIITSENDSLNCKITKIKGDHIYFTFVKDGEIRNTLISKNDVKQYSKNINGNPDETQINKSFNRTYSVFRLAVHGGFASRLGKVQDADLKDYMKDLKKGMNYGFDASFFISESVGFGIKYQAFNSSNSLSNVIMDHDGDGITSTGTISDNIAITFIGPTYTTRLASSRENAFISTFGLGYIGYKDNAKVFNYPTEITGSSLGLALDLGYDFKISKNLFFGVQCSYISGVLTKMTVGSGPYSQEIELDKENRENLSSLNISAGLRFEL